MCLFLIDFLSIYDIFQLIKQLIIRCLTKNYFEKNTPFFD